MLKKFISVRNVGRFINSASAGVLAYEKITLILGGNGFGKTTLCAILRSLAANDPAIVLGRTRLGSTAAPEIEILLNTGNVTYRDGSWSGSTPDFIIFDGTFIEKNIHAGDVVDLEQRRNLYRVIIGSEGIGLAVEEESLAGESRAKASDIKAAEKAIQSHAPSGMGIEEFIALPADPEIDAKIIAQTQMIEAVRASEQLKARASLTLARLPSLPADFETMLGKTLEGIAQDAQKLIAAHIDRHSMGERGEAWLQEGTDRIVEDNCPYCGQSVKGLSLIDAYRKVFGEAYRDMKAAVRRTQTAIEHDFGPGAVGSFDTLFEANRGGAEFWSRYYKLPDLAPPNEATKVVSELGVAALARLSMKAAAPQEAVPVDAVFASAAEQFKAAAAAINAYNEAINDANGAIMTKKSAIASGDLKREGAALARLTAQKKRGDPQVAVLCSEYERFLKEKNAFDRQKTEVRIRLEEHTNKVIKPYEGRINQLLDNFNAGFKITQTKPAYTGGVASTTYQLVINDTGVDLGDSKTPANRPSFKNTLSAGGRSTLALAVFIAHLERDPDRANQIAVFDDPFTSQDSFRRRQTVYEIAKVGAACKQLIVLSHDAAFLRQIRDKSKPGECVVLQLVDQRSLGMKIMPCDLDESCRGRAASDMDDLQGYATTGAGKVRDIIRKMRIVLETYCRSTYPAFFAPDDTLGRIVEKIKVQGDSSRDHHHGEDPEDGSSDLIDAAELAGFVKRTLRLVNNLQA